ncbi:MAG: hypoxanthine phosphoribosyltransferase [Lachnospiraceae bacterium]|nr:hypoxanthine phosphoribosyltransferase [Lachnospiraceae bacterium]
MKLNIRTLITKEEIDKRVKELGKQITEDYKDKDILTVAVLKGALPFLCDLVHQIDNEDLTMDFMSVSSYGSETKSSGVVRILKDLEESIEGKNVLIVEDIIDSGRTISKLIELLSTRNPKSIKICSLLDKPSRREVEVKADYVGFTIEDRFVLGYGLDYDQKYRQLTFIGEVVSDK